MRKFRKLAALCAVFVIILSFGVVVHAEEATPTNPPAVSQGGQVTTPDGTGTVIASSTSGEKQFYTIKTPAGNIFYLIIDLTQKSNNVYFLDNVMEKDLLALANKDASGANAGTSSENSGIGSNNTTSQSTASTPAPANTSTQSSGPNFSLILLVAIVVIGGGAGIYFKFFRNKKKMDTRNEYEAEDDEYMPNEPEADSEEYGTGTEDEYEAPTWEEDEE